MKSTHLHAERLIMGRLLFGFYFASLLFRFFQQVTPSRMQQPVLYRYNFDFTYWLFDLAGIYRFVIQSGTGSVVFDLLLFGSCFICVVYPLKNFWAILFGTLFFIYVVCYNAFIVHHSHPMALMTLAMVPFFVKSAGQWRLLWEGFRYYVCFAYFISFVWKAFIGKSLFFWNMGVNSAKLNLVEYLYHYPETGMADVFRFFISHPALLNIGLIFVFLLEGFMLIGFFTKRFDFLLLWIPVLVHLSTYLFSDVYFFEMLVGVFAFVSFRGYAKLGNRFPILIKSVPEKQV